MPYTINAFDDAEWKRHGLADFSEFADQITECNMGEDAFSGFGEWVFVPDEPLPNGDRVIYFGSWGNDNSPGASTYTNAEIFDALDPNQLIEFSKRVDHWESLPEYVESDDDYDSDGELAEDRMALPWGDFGWSARSGGTHARGRVSKTASEHCGTTGGGLDWACW